MAAAATTNPSSENAKETTKTFLGQEPIPFKHQEIIRTHLESLSLENKTKYQAFDQQERHEYLLANVFWYVLKYHYLIYI